MATLITSTGTPFFWGGTAKKLKEGNSRTPRGNPVCFRYNAKGCAKGAKCHFAHVCMLCFGKQVPDQADGDATASGTKVTN